LTDIEGPSAGGGEGAAGSGDGSSRSRLAELGRLAESAPCGLLTTTADGSLLLVNETLLRWTGRRRDELVGRTFEELLTTAGRLFYQTRYVPVLRLSGEVREAALTLRRSDGSELPVLASSLLHAGAGGDVVTVALFDATGRRDYERELLAARREADRSERRVRVLQEASVSFDDCDTEGALAVALARAARTAAEAMSSAVFVLDGAVLRRIRLQDRLRHSSLHDSLTALPNRAHLHERLTEALDAAAQTRRPLALLFVDLDGFKAINDRLGHAVGDDVLAQVAERLRRLVRRDDTVARFGGDEFAIVCVEADVAAAVRVADRVRDAMREPLRGVPEGYPLTASIGVALHEPHAGTVSAEDLVVAADGAMYRSKSEGRDRNSVVRA
jgi:diguanylate cyclase (GGDEF)-like protein/PAS domain S-box-containing protein